MTCPHCLTDFHDAEQETQVTWRSKRLSDESGVWSVHSQVCPACARAIILLKSTKWNAAGGDLVERSQQHQVWPKRTARASLPPEVPELFTNDYREACAVLSDSPRASAAMSRFCLQRLLRDKAGAKPGDLSVEIDQVLATNALPSDLAADLDAIRVIGNFGAHPIKTKNTGEIVDVEPGEAEHLLDVLDELFDFYFVRPAGKAAKRAEINKKLADAGKPPLKAPA